MAAAYASPFAATPISELAGRKFGISELSPTGYDISRALEARYGREPRIFHHDLQTIDDELDLAIEKGSPAAAVWYYRRLWGAGKLTQLGVSDIWIVPEYTKMSLEDLVVHGKLGNSRDLPQPVLAGTARHFPVGGSATNEFLGLRRNL